MDALTDILNTLRLKSSLYFRTELTAPWGIQVPLKGRVARFQMTVLFKYRGHRSWSRESSRRASSDRITSPNSACPQYRATFKPKALVFCLFWRRHSRGEERCFMTVKKRGEEKRLKYRFMLCVATAICDCWLGPLAGF